MWRAISDLSGAIIGQLTAEFTCQIAVMRALVARRCLVEVYSSSKASQVVVRAIGGTAGGMGWGTFLATRSS